MTNTNSKLNNGGILFNRRRQGGGYGGVSEVKLTDAKIKSLRAKFAPTTNPLASFCVFPKKVSFQTQEKGEEIILLLRRHPVTNLPWIIISIILILAPVVGLPIVDISGVIALLDQISLGLLPVLVAFWYLAVTGYILLNFFFWYFNVNIVTNRRVLDFDFFYLLYREFTEALLASVEDVTSTGGGLFAALFDYGDVSVQTAAAVERIEFTRIPRPQEVVRIISQLVEAVQQ